MIGAGCERRGVRFEVFDALLATNINTTTAVFDRGIRRSILVTVDNAFDSAQVLRLDAGDHRKRDGTGDNHPDQAWVLCSSHVLLSFFDGQRRIPRTSSRQKTGLHGKGDHLAKGLLQN